MGGGLSAAMLPCMQYCGSKTINPYTPATKNTRLAHFMADYFCTLSSVSLHREPVNPTNQQRLRRESRQQIPWSHCIAAAWNRPPFLLVVSPSLSPSPMIEIRRVRFLLLMPGRHCDSLEHATDRLAEGCARRTKAHSRLRSCARKPSHVSLSAVTRRLASP